MYHFVTELYTCVHISDTKLGDIRLMHCGICEMIILAGTGASSFFINCFYAIYSGQNTGLLKAIKRTSTRVDCAERYKRLTFLRFITRGKIDLFYIG